ncbi:MAG: hypothetical protein AUK44_04810 [Porphyromonadaceae bacterium CG2_30_38_12]|nr:MAG: hypothetical protein AUK44_04810 [Porphyromonadaceae bacterium CG2_30_38_12]
MNYSKGKQSVLLSILFLFGFVAFSAAQNRIITGNVKDAVSKEDLIGATVQSLISSSKGTITDIDGNFTLTLAPTETELVVSYVGYEKKTVNVKGLTKVDITLAPLTKLIDEVVVIGYGTQRKSDITGAVSVVDTKDIMRANASSFDKALQGKAAGVMVTQNSGQPGENSSIRIRGIGSISKSSDPLYVIDGLITNASSLNSINPADIESLQVLKDASSASIYGAQGANGVILVTTKKGEKGKAKLNFSHYTGISEVPNYFDVMNGDEYAGLMSKAWANEIAKNPEQSDAFKKVYDAYLTDPNRQSVNMPRLLTQTGLKQDFSLSATGGGDNSRFAFSGNYYDEKGTMINTNFKRYSLRLNSEFDINKRWKIGETFSFSRIEDRKTSQLGGNLWQSAVITSPIMHLYEPDNLGGFGGPDQTITGANDKSNPFAEQSLNKNTSQNNRVNGSVYSQYEFIKGLTYKFNLGFEYSNSYGNLWAPAYFLGPYGNRNNPTSTLTERNTLSQSYIVSNVLNYIFTVGEDHNFNIMAGHEAVNASYNYTSATGSNFVSDAINVMSQAQTTNAIAGEITEHRTLSYFGRFMYDYKGKYLFTSSIRRDGSSRFGALSRIGYFPSFAFAYKVNEDFLKEVRQLDLFKVRVGWGKTGNENIGDYGFADYIQGPRESRYVFGTDQHTVYGGTILRSFGNEAIRWEAAQMTNFGLDINAFKNSIQFTAEYYYKKQDDMLVKIDLPRVFGRQNPDANPWVNIGQIDNKGFEFNLVYKKTIGDLYYSASANLTTINNKVVYLPNHIPIYGSSTITAENHAIGSFYGYIFDGIFQSTTDVANSPSQTGNPQPGDMKYRDLNQDGAITELDRTIIGKPTPDYIYGFNFEVNYKNFDFNANFQGVQGVEIFNAVRQSIGLGTDGSGHDNNRLRSVQNYWSPTNPTNSQTRLGVSDAANNTRTSTFFIEDGAYLRLKSIQLGYNFPAAVNKFVGIKKSRVYVSGNNLLTLTKYSGIDPEISSWNPLGSNIDWGAYPVPKSYMAGIVIDF